MTAPLKPCPFCGGVKHMVMPPNCKKDNDYKPGDNAQPFVRCLNCYAEAMGSAWDYTKGTAITAWNTRADAPELVALVAAVKAEIEARNRFLSTAPDRGGSHGPKGQRKMALENAQLATTFALAAYEALK